MSDPYESDERDDLDGIDGCAICQEPHPDYALVKCHGFLCDLRICQACDEAKTCSCYEAEDEEEEPCDTAFKAASDAMLRHLKGEATAQDAVRAFNAYSIAKSVRKGE